VALHDVKKLYNAAKTKLGEFKTKIAAAAPQPQPLAPQLLVAAKSFAASRSLPTLQPDEPNSFFAAIEALISTLERNLADAKLQEDAAQKSLKTPPTSPKITNSEKLGSGREGSNDRGLSRLSMSPIAAGAGGSFVAEQGSGDAAVVTTFASITGGGAFTSPKKNNSSSVSEATTAAAMDAESIARIQLHNIDLQRRVERLQMSMKVAATLACALLWI
jgi:hypothetical protein